VVVRVGATDRAWTFEVDDDGRGFEFAGRRSQSDLDAERKGPVIIKERIRSIGGHLAVESHPGRGARLEISLPRPPHGQQVRILIAGDHPILRDGLRKLLEAEPDFVVVGEACDGPQAVERVKQLEPDVLLLDPAIVGASYLEVLRAVATGARTRPLLLTAGIEPDEVLKALEAGACGIVLKSVASELLMKAIRTVTAGEYWVARDSVGSLVGTFQSRPAAALDRDRQFGLTRRELEIVTAVATGLTNKEIARRFSLSEETVKHHLTRIFAKLEVANRVELTLFAVNEQLVPPALSPRPKPAKDEH
jgi:two-component system, NarL family, nitrate/nitrite response regulator NarL